MPVSITVTGYGNAAVEFWTDAKPANQIALYGAGVAIEVDLTFP